MTSNYSIVEYLVKHNLIDLTFYRDTDGNNPLIMATIHSDLRIAKFLINYDKDLLDRRNYVRIS